jgi:tetratricopeptide (TPR) repeat protein
LFAASRSILRSKLVFMAVQPSSTNALPLDYERAFSGASRKALEHLESVISNRDAAPSHLAELLSIGRRERERALESSRFHTYALATHALKCSEREMSRDSARARELAGLARSVIGRLDPRTCGGTETVIELEAYALAVQGTAFRVRGDLRRSLRAFTSARILSRQGGVDPDLPATIDLLESSLRRELRQLDSALALLDRATDVFVLLEDQERVTHAVINRANIHIVRGEWAEAVAILRNSLEWISAPRFTLAARHNLADALVKGGCAHEAAQVFSATRDLYDRFADALTTNRRLWLEGLIAREIGDDLQFAAGLLETATKNLMAQGYAHDAALAQLDLAVTRRKLALARKLRRRNAPSHPERLPHPLHPRIAAAQQDAHPAAEEAASSLGAREDSGQSGGPRGLHDDFEIAGDHPQGRQDRAVRDREDPRGVPPDQLEVEDPRLGGGQAVGHGLHPLGRSGHAGRQRTDDAVGAVRLDSVDPRAGSEAAGRQ